MSRLRRRSGKPPLLAPGTWWVVVGVALGYGVAGLLTIGVLFVALGLALAGAGVAMRWTRNRSAFMAITGAAAGPLVVAWHNRRGPSNECRTHGDVTGCVDRWNPWPFVVVAAVLVVGGIVLAMRNRLHA